MTSGIETARDDLWDWSRAQNFAGYDPYDALNSRLFQFSPLNGSRSARLAWTQFFKRSPFNFRNFAGVPRERNAKGIALFALAALADFRCRPTKENEVAARDLLDDLLAMGLKGFHGAAWGYNFDWQSRVFFAPRGTPTIVPTAFAARALIEAAVVFDDREYLQFARTVCDFILRDLKRTVENAEEICFSYSPMDQTCVFNASLLGAEVLAGVGGLHREDSLCEMALRAARYVVKRQHEDGSWSYGADDRQQWSDNFHTAFILTSLSRILDALSASGAAMDGVDFDTALHRGYEFWTERFFLTNGWPKYYPDRLYPADAHSAAAAIVALVELHKRIPGARMLAERIAEWAIENLRDRRGFFYYQCRRFHAVRIPYMRWSQAWMVYGLSRLLELTDRK